METIRDGKRKPQHPVIEFNPLVKWFMLGLGALGLLVTALIILGWLPLGPRANILRTDLNWIEYGAIIFSTLYATACLRTFRGLLDNEKASISWSRWVTFATIFIGFILILSVVIPGLLKQPLLTTPEGTQPAEFQVMQGGLLLVFAGILGLMYKFSVQGGLVSRQISETINFPRRYALLLIVLGFLVIIPANLSWVLQFPGDAPNIRTPEPWRLIPGIILFLVSIMAYFHVCQGEEESDEFRRAISLTPGKFVQTQLSKSPSAGAIIGFIAIFMVFTMATDLFLRPTSIASILTNVSSKGMIAIGVTILMISGEFDLSVGSILGVVAMFFMAAMTVGDPIFGLIMDPLPAAIYAIFIGAVLGFINGFILVTTKIPSFIVTLGTLLAYRAITLVAIAGGRILRYRDHYDEFPQTLLSPWFFVGLSVLGLAVLLYSAYRTLPTAWSNVTTLWNKRADNGDFGTTSALFNGVIAIAVTVVLFVVGAWLVTLALFHLDGDTIQVGFFNIVNGRWDGNFLMNQTSAFSLDVPGDSNFRMAILWWSIFVVIFHIILTSTKYGNSVFAVGGNVGAARAQGINVPYVKVFNFTLVATLTAIAAIYETARNPGVDPLKGNGWELDIIAMTVIGGALLSGGYGSIIGSLLGALIFGMLQTGLVLVGIESRLFSGTIGVVIIVAVVLNTTVRGRQGN